MAVPTPDLKVAGGEELAADGLEPVVAVDDPLETAESAYRGGGYHHGGGHYYGHHHGHYHHGHHGYYHG